MSEKQIEYRYTKVIVSHNRLLDITRDYLEKFCTTDCPDCLASVAEGALGFDSYGVELHENNSFEITLKDDYLEYFVIKDQRDEKVKEVMYAEELSRNYVIELEGDELDCVETLPESKFEARLIEAGASDIMFDHIDDDAMGLFFAAPYDKRDKIVQLVKTIISAYKDSV